MNPLVCSCHRAGPFELYQPDCRGKSLSASGLFAIEVNLTQLIESAPLTLCDAWRDLFEVPVMAQEDSVLILGDPGDDRIGGIGGDHVTKADYSVTPAFKELADRLRHIVVSEKPQLGGRAQAATFMSRRTLDTSKRSSVGYSSTMALSA